MTLKLALGLAVATCSPLAAPPRAAAQTVTALPKLDLNRFTGTWYEVARLPSKSEKHCIGMPLALYALGDKPGHLQVVNSCPIKDGSTSIRNASGKVANKTGDGKLKVSYTFPFSSPQWVLATGQDYEWALVGSPNHKNLWIFSRTATIRPDALAEARSKAAAQGFNTARLITSNAPAAAPAPAPVQPAGKGD